MILLRKKLSDGLIGLKLTWFRQWNILGSIQSNSKYNFIELDGDQAVEAVRQELLLKVFG